MLGRDAADRAGARTGLSGDRGADGHQRGDLHAVADAAEPGHLRFDLCLGTSGADVGQFGGRQDTDDSFIADLLSTILPVLDHFNIYGAISTGQTVPLAILLWSTVYCLLYSTVAMLFALLMFEDRDLA